MKFKPYEEDAVRGITNNLLKSSREALLNVREYLNMLPEDSKPTAAIIELAEAIHRLNRAIIANGGLDND